ncbi:MAG: class I SAM-dependent methyltransferase [bacterium]
MSTPQAQEADVGGRKKQEIYASEAAFFDAIAEGEVEARYGGELKIRPEEHLATLQLYGLTGDLTGKRVVDCACGTGFFSSLLAMRGAEVWSFDLSPRCVEVTQERARANGVSDRVHASVQPFEHLDYEPASYDYIVGKNILHHIPKIEEAGEVMYRLLKPGGKALFYDLQATNPILMFFRKYIIGKISFIPKRGTPDEHPLTADEVEALSKVFQGRIRVSYPKFRFFGKFDRQIFARRVKLVSMICDGLDRFIYDHFPSLRKYSYKIFVELTR